MKRSCALMTFLPILLIFIHVSAGIGSESWSVKSPDGKVEVIVKRGDVGGPYPEKRQSMLKPY